MVPPRLSKSFAKICCVKSTDVAPKQWCAACHTHCSADIARHGAPQVGANISPMNCSFFVGERVSSRMRSTLTPSPCKAATQVSRYRAATELLISK